MGGRIHGVRQHPSDDSGWYASHEWATPVQAHSSLEIRASFRLLPRLISRVDAVVGVGDLECGVKQNASGGACAASFLV